MALHLHDTLSGEKKEFIPQKSGEVTMYNCGPTVYNYLHIGNLRTFVMNDLLRRALEANSYTVKQVMNITDIDDKMIKGAEKEGISMEALAKKYEALFLEDLKSLNIEIPKRMPHATACIPDMIAMIETLIKKGDAYVAADGVYFSIEKSKNYGKLAHLELRKENRERIHNDEYGKENPQDFALWKFPKTESEISWEASFGKGRPGWHIECSAMSLKELGPTIDIHTGGVDLIFPHHTNEIAQSEAANDAPFVKYWVHGEFLNVSGDKMAKSAGNFIRLIDLKEKGIHPLSYRYYLLQAHYRTPMNFSLDAVQAAQSGFINILNEIATFKRSHPFSGKILTEHVQKFNSFINDDLNIPKSLALLHEILKLSPSEDLVATIEEFDKVLGLKIKEITDKLAYNPLPPEIQRLFNEYDVKRKAKDFEKSDALRMQIKKAGYELQVRENDESVIIPSLFSLAE